MAANLDDKLNQVRDNIQKKPHILSGEEKKREVVGILSGLTRSEIEELAKKTWELEDASITPIEQSNMMEVATHMLTHNGGNETTITGGGTTPTGEEPTVEDEFKKGKHPFDKDQDEKEKQKEKLKDKQKYKIDGVISRGVKDRMPLDSDNLGEKYPNQFTFKTDQEIAEWLVLSPEGKKLLEQEAIGKALKNKEIGESQAIQRLLQEIKDDRAMLASPSNRERLQHFLDTSFDAIAKVFHMYDPSYNPLPTKDKVRFLGKKEFFAQKGGAYISGVGGVCFMESGQIFVNMDSIKTMPEEAIAETIKHIITHEVTHGTSSLNYRNIAFEDAGGAKGNEQIVRRNGLSFLKPKIENNKISFIERGVAITEAVTEKLSIEALQLIYGTKEMPTTFNAYVAERKVLDLMSEIFKIPFAYFAAASLDRRQLRKLAEMINGKTVENGNISYKRPGLFSQLLTVMQKEFAASTPDNRTTYPETTKLIMQYSLHI